MQHKAAIKVNVEGTVEIIGSTLEDLQKAVGGYIEAIHIPGSRFYLVVNEDGRMLKLKKNLYASYLLQDYEDILGNAVIIREENL